LLPMFPNGRLGWKETELSERRKGKIYQNNICRPAGTEAVFRLYDTLRACVMNILLANNKTSRNNQTVTHMNSCRLPREHMSKLVAFVIS